MVLPFELTGVINKNFLLKVKKHLIPSWFKCLIFIFEIALIIWALLEPAKSMLLFMIFLLSLVAMFMTYLYIQSEIIKQYLEWAEDFCHSRDLVYKVDFGEESVKLTTADWSGIEMPYGIFKTVVETKMLYFLSSGGLIPIIILKEFMQDVPEESWKEFLTEKCGAGCKIKFL